MGALFSLVDSLVAFLPARLQDKAKAIVAAFAPIIIGVTALWILGELSWGTVVGFLILGSVTGVATFTVPNRKAIEAVAKEYVPEHAAV